MTKWRIFISILNIFSKNKRAENLAQELIKSLSELQFKTKKFKTKIQLENSK